MDASAPFLALCCIGRTILNMTYERYEEEAGHNLEMLKRHAVFGTAAQVKAGIRKLADAGLQYLILNMPPRREGAMLKRFAEEIIPSFS
jgi:alkanesulfonate monooxygenase SsuD/methylene tetrahydromethanopterin reductase-like flavin-dependent oxidoreductase (luciferase family)